jgi:hypothetical protein
MEDITGVARRAVDLSVSPFCGSWCQDLTVI